MPNVPVHLEGGTMGQGGIPFPDPLRSSEALIDRFGLTPQEWESIGQWVLDYLGKERFGTGIRSIIATAIAINAKYERLREDVELVSMFSQTNSETGQWTAHDGRSFTVVPTGTRLLKKFTSRTGPEPLQPKQNGTMPPLDQLNAYLDAEYKNFSIDETKRHLVEFARLGSPLPNIVLRTTTWQKIRQWLERAGLRPRSVRNTTTPLLRQKEPGNILSKDLTWQEWDRLSPEEQQAILRLYEDLP